MMEDLVIKEYILKHHTNYHPIFDDILIRSVAETKVLSVTMKYLDNDYYSIKDGRLVHKMDGNRLSK